MRYYPLLLLLMVVALLLMAFIRCLGKYNEIYHTVRSWFWMLLVLWLAFMMGRYGVLALGVFMGVVGVCELSKVVIRWTWRDGMFLGCIVLFVLAWVWLSLTIEPLSVLLFVLFVVQFNDVCQYVMGRLLGGRIFSARLAPNISPNKTIEGALFGVLLMTIIGVMIGQWLTNFGVGMLILMAVWLGVFGIIGDLLESGVKRRHHVKDMGVWLAGHGGLLDRIDSLLVGVPLFAVLVAIL